MRVAFEPLALARQRLAEEFDLYDLIVESIDNGRMHTGGAAQKLARTARRSLYVNVIIGCYGLIEQTIDLLVTATAELYGNIYQANERLPEVVKTSHRELLLRCLVEGDRARTRSAVAERVAIAALSAETSAAVSLVGAVFTHSTANYRIGQIRDLFRRLDVSLDDRLKPDDLTVLDALGFSSYESFLEDLVSRRNELAHSYNDDGILDRAALKNVSLVTIEFLDKVASFVGAEVLIKLAEESLVAIGQVVRYWTGRLGVVVTSGSLKVGDRLTIVKGDRVAVLEVESLMSEDVAGSEFHYADAALNVSVGTSGASEWMVSGRAYSLPHDWRDVW
ncbi:hypothetical protein [Cellulosimicrobium cellulans]|uniref:RiboL-PSP-HEPN domain-containing protein n=1 Tax=Cellulosimicrobium cellulans TaxID=1710 RepID=A0A4Y4DWS5_CELCE|nr:hypothetical protein [Cellulosimicrobium cellulans]GED09496.1 hypothetical protein CCE02nite_14950 [Cellulosimicrobium cellulans]